MLLVSQGALAQSFNYFVPGPSGQVEVSNGTATLQAATSSNIAGLWIGSGCTIGGAVTPLLNGLCAPALTIPLPVSQGGTGSTTLSGAFIVTAQGVITSGDCVQWFNPTVVIDSGAPCGGGGGPSSAFSALTSSTNVTATMIIGTGASLFTTGSGTISATNTIAVNGAAIPANASVLGSNSSRQIIAQTTTGTGSSVLAASPVIVTPNLGVPSFLTLTNATGCNLATCVTGNLPVTNLNNGTGANSTTFWAGNGIWATPAGSAGANPTSQIGLTAVNGSATTYMRSDAAPALNQGISPTMTGMWIFTNPTNGITPSTSTWAEDFHLNDQQASGHSYGDISGYCNGAAPGNWSLFDYTVGTSRLCIGPTGTVVIPTPSSGESLVTNGPIEALTPNGTDVGILATTNSTENAVLEVNDTASTSASGMPAHSVGLATTTGNLFLHAAGGLVATESAFEANGFQDYPTSTPNLTAHAGHVESPLFKTYVGLNLSWNGADWISGTDGGSNGGALISATQQGVYCIQTLPSSGGTNRVIPDGSLPTCALQIDGSQNITTPGAASVPWLTGRLAFGGCGASGGISAGANQGLSTCTNTATGNYTVAFTGSYLVATPRCTLTVVTGSAGLSYLADIVSISNTGFTFTVINTVSNFVNAPTDFTCMSTN